MLIRILSWLLNTVALWLFDFAHWFCTKAYMFDKCHQTGYWEKAEAELDEIIARTAKEIGLERGSSTDESVH
jgi:hypothetical protein